MYLLFDVSFRHEFVMPQSFHQFLHAGNLGVGHFASFAKDIDKPVHVAHCVSPRR